MHLPDVQTNRAFLVDDYSRWMWVYILKDKAESFDALRNFKRLVENKSDNKIKILRTKRCKEFTSQKFMKFCKEEGVVRHHTSPYLHRKTVWWEE